MTARAPNPYRQVAVVMDFDETIAPDATSLLLRERGGLDPLVLWKQEAPKLYARGYDMAHAWIRLLLDQVGDGRPLGLLTNSDLRAFGLRMEREIYPGLLDLPRDVKQIAHDFGWTADFYIVSGGLEELIRGIPFVKNNFTEVYGTLIDEDGDPPRLSWVKRAITFTEKTRYLYEIHKGITPEECLKDPHAVNRFMDQEDREVPWECMVYVGDGFTDIPCFAMLEGAGLRFGVVRTDDEARSKAAFDLLQTNRVDNAGPADYTKAGGLGWCIREAVSAICGRGQPSRRKPK
jgi:hypothetical protein